MLVDDIFKICISIIGNKIKLQEIPKTYEYQGLKKTLDWLREKLRDGNNLEDKKIIENIIFKMDNPQPST